MKIRSVICLYSLSVCNLPYRNCSLPRSYFNSELVHFHLLNMGFVFY